MRKGRENTAVAGLSLGSAQAALSALRHPDLFGYFGVFSGGFSDTLQDLEDSAPVYGQIFLTSGIYENMHDLNERIAGKLRKAGSFVTVREYPGFHEWEPWRRSLHDFCDAIFRDEELEQYKEQYIRQYFGEDAQNDGNENESRSAGTLLSGNLTRIEQTELIERLPLPEFLRDILLDYNNEEGYERLGVSTFQDYLINFIATGILNVVSFLLAVLVVHLLLWLLISALSILTNLPVIRVVNRAAGLVLGLLQALLLLWLAFLVLSLVSGTDMGMQLMEMVESSNWLNWLYQSNLFLEIVLRTSAFFG